MLQHNVGEEVNDVEDVDVGEGVTGMGPGACGWGVKESVAGVRTCLDLGCLAESGTC